MAKKVQEAECVRIYGKYTKNGKNIYWVFAKNSKKKNIARSLVQVLELVERFTN